MITKLNKFIEQLNEAKELSKDDFVNENVSTPDIYDAFEFIFRDYAKLYDKWMPIAFKGVEKPNLLPVIKKVHKKFIGFKSENFNYSVDELVNNYIKYQLNNVPQNANKNFIKMSMKSYGVDTLDKKYISKFDILYILEED